ncbi:MULTISPECIES: transposase family protein [Staphylococcus]|uniref:transposase family protein n=1 Tax=Staphylococcus TaxID=1279 RepID=UPI0012B85EC1|nr:MULTISPECIES: transposase family protein [Staphylococcus]QPA25185.1 transposase [Mammaliicoccus fleurettii]QPA35415.1 transposase [Mammaliicoccus fleurettii]UXR55917.1 hypothetical protein MUA46_05275 [Staphylococcus schleiferi]
MSSLLSFESKPNTQTRKTFIANYFFKIPRDSSVFKSVKTMFKCRVCGRTFTSKTNVVEDNCFISNHVQKAIIDKATQVRSETDIASDCNVSASSVKRVIHKVSNATFQ